VQRNQRFDRLARWSAVALIATVIADLAEDLIDPAPSGKAAEIFSAASHHHGAMIGSAALLLLTSLLIVPAVYGLVRALGDRGRRVGRAATVLGLMGALGHAALAALYLGWAAMPSARTDEAEMIAVIERMSDSASFALLLPLILAFPLALVVLLVAMVRGRIAPRWVLVPALAAPVAAAVAPGGGAAATAAALGCFLIAAIAVAAQVFAPEPTAARGSLAAAPA
jgi:hypothetical protein